jgi:K+-transporting ATPase KdpF subunit
MPRAEAVEGRPRVIGNIVLLALSAILLVYLVYALLRPEKF